MSASWVLFLAIIYLAVLKMFFNLILGHPFPGWSLGRVRTINFLWASNVFGTIPALIRWILRF